MDDQFFDFPLTAFLLSPFFGLVVTVTWSLAAAKALAFDYHVIGVVSEPIVHVAHGIRGPLGRVVGVIGGLLPLRNTRVGLDQLAFGVEAHQLLIATHVDGVSDVPRGAE